MKTKRILLLILAAAAVLATGCTKKYYTEEYITQQTIVQGTEMTFVDFEVEQKNWAPMEVKNGNTDEGYFQVILNLPDDVTKAMKDDCSVQVDRRYFEGNDVTATPLPAIRVEKDAEENYFTTFVDYEWRKGTIYIYVTTSDLFIGEGKDLIVPPAMNFRVIISQ